MITLVYASKNKNLTLEEKWVSNIGITGVQILHYSEGCFAKAYNKALKESKSDIIVFLRDVEIETKNWGQKIVEWFNAKEHGILGIVGSIIVPMSGLVWEKEEPLVGRIWYTSYDPENEQKFSEAFPGKVLDVITVDDAFFAINRKKIVREFDEGYSEDSFYELDFCLSNYEKGVKVGVIFDIKVLKYELNSQDEAWLKNRKYFVSKHKNLPLRIKPEIFLSTTHIKLEREPKVSIIVSSKGKPVELASCLEALYEKSKYPNMEIFVVDLGSKEEELESIKEFLKVHPNTTLIEMKHEHMPTIHEEVVSKYISSDTELLLFVDPEVILLNDALSRMVKTYLENPLDCGTLGIRMHTKNNMVRHFGLQLFSTETNDGYELGLRYSGFQSSYKYQNKVMKGVLGSSKDFLMIPKKLYLDIGGFNKEYLHSLEDFELNLRSILAGKKNFIVGTAAAYYLGQEMPKFLPLDFERLVEYINQNVTMITPYVDLMSAA